MSALLKSKCAGLLEVSEISENLESDPLSNVANYGNQELELASLGDAGPNVTFLHRTVQDFLNRPDIQTFLKSWQVEEFNATDCLLRAYILSLKMATLDDDYDFGLISRRAKDALVIAHRARKTSFGLDNQLLSDLDEIVTDHWLQIPVTNNEVGRSKGQHWADWVDKEGYKKTEKDHVDFVGLAISHGLHELVAAKIEEDDKQVERKRGHPYLDYVFHYKHGIPGQLDMISVLLKGGANPNQRFRDHTF
ncbi:hypothetical protein BKA65DRAFT_471547 [Rhexocercosporidium sp. MPI-PUGE-AT-0058]|nr:hypothetical protein BKA65DRAFT_471547 [Rhexocercosporidium sp. MPI-PUGE-AT-0058]